MNAPLKPEWGRRGFQVTGVFARNCVLFITPVTVDSARYYIDANLSNNDGPEGVRFNKR